MPDDATDTVKPRARLARRVVVAVVTLASVAWVLVLLADAWPAMVAHIHEVRVSLLLLGLALSIASAYLTFEAFAALAKAIGIVDMPRPQLAHLYFTGQLLKHLPGRIWGVGYQWAAGRSAGSLKAWLLTNLAHMALASFFALWTAWLFLATAAGPAWAMLALVAGLAMYSLGWWWLSSPGLQRLIARLPGRIGETSKGLVVLAAVPGAARVRIFVLFCGTWVLFYSAWIAFGASYPALGASGGAQLCAYYMVAWFVGYISLLTPSGLGVRELVFAWMASGFSPDVIALMAIVGRASLLAVDIVLGLLFAPFAPRGD